ncbi:MAG: glycine cleavage system protein H [candidate division Zixibacteria bacterium]|nr:glycine cleavage system protein H [candidate division Zixibacteria bacterium]
MSIILALVFFTLVITVGYLINRRKAPAKKEVAKKALTLKGIFAHPGHTWVEVLESDLVNVGMDKFAKSVFGSIERIAAPQKGETINQGGRAWTLEKNGRQLNQVSPISGKVVEVNQAILNNPKTLNDERNAEKSWILKIEPIKLKRELRNLLYGDMANRWTQAVKEQLVATLTIAEFPVLQEGGDIMPNLGDELTPQQWERVVREFFNTS